MAILTYPLNGILYDAEDVETYLCTRTSGVFSDDGHFPASVTGSREITIGPGLAWMQNEEFHGKAVYNPENVALTIAEADAYQTRIDRIVLQFDKLMNQTTLVVKQGTSASSPVAPDIERDAYIYELGLYTVNVKASSISISESDVGSTMLDESVCGIMEDAVTSIPTQELYDQWYAWFADLQTDTETLESQFNLWFEQIREESETYMTEVKSEFEVWMNGEKVDFDTWFDSIQDTLDSDTAGKLTNLVNDAQDTADEALEQLITGMVRGYMTDEADGGEYALQADDADETHAITLSRNICDCGDMASASTDMITDQFQDTFVYKEGEYCIYQDTLYVFTADKSAGAWDWNCVKATNVGTELTNVEQAIAGLGTITAVEMTAESVVNSFYNTSYYKDGVLYIAVRFKTSSGALSTDATVNICKITNFDISLPYSIAIDCSYYDTTTARGIGGAWLIDGGYLGVKCYGTISDGNVYLSGTILLDAFDSSANISPQGWPDDDDSDVKVAPGPEIIDPDDDDDGTIIGPGPEEVE